MRENKARSYFAYKRYFSVTIRSLAKLEKLTVAQLKKKFPILYETRRLISVFTRYYRWNLTWTTLIQFTSSNRISLQYILVLFSHACLSLSFKFFDQNFVLLFTFSVWATRPVHLTLLDLTSHSIRWRVQLIKLLLLTFSLLWNKNWKPRSISEILISQCGYEDGSVPGQLRRVV